MGVARIDGVRGAVVLERLGHVGLLLAHAAEHRQRAHVAGVAFEHLPTPTASARVDDKRHVIDSKEPLTDRFGMLARRRQVARLERVFAQLACNSRQSVANHDKFEGASAPRA